MKDPGMPCKGAQVRVHVPDHSKDKTAEAVKSATKKFMEAMLQTKRKEGAQ